MGRLTLNVMLSFAQFEREVTGERIRDKIAASKEKGIWMGGVVPLGYRVENRKLLVDEAEAETVRLVFKRYLELGSLPALQRDLRERGITSRSRVLASGKLIGGVSLTNGPLAHILKNRMVLGELNHKGTSYRSEHPAIADAELFDAVQVKLAANLNRRDLRKGKSDALLTGCIFDDRGNPMSPSNTVKKGLRYRYYVSTAAIQGRRAEAGSIARAPAAEIETLAVDALDLQLGETLPGDAQAQRDLFKQLALHVNVSSQALELTWTDAADEHSIEAAPSADHAQHPDDLRKQHLKLPYTCQAHKRRRDIVLPESPSGYLRPIEQQEQQSLVRSIAHGRGWLKEIVAGITIAAISSRESRSERTIRMLVSLAFLDPKLVQAALHGALPRGISTRRLIDAPVLWPEQWQAVGLSRPS